MDRKVDEMMTELDIAKAKTRATEEALQAEIENSMRMYKGFSHLAERVLVASNVKFFDLTEDERQTAVTLLMNECMNWEEPNGRRKR